MESLIIMACSSYLFIKAMGKNKTIVVNSEKDSSGKIKKFPGYQIQDQKIYITDSAKAKKFVFDLGKNQPEGALFKLAFGNDQLSYTDTKVQNDSYRTNIVVKEKEQQDAVYVLLMYLFAGAYQQSPHRAGNYADIINQFSIYVKNMFNRDLPIIKSIDDAKILFEETAKTL